jgi:SPX domain protein involved in polyphosphate accumulation
MICIFDVFTTSCCIVLEVEPSALLYVKVHLLKHQPILVLGRKEADLATEGTFIKWKPDMCETHRNDSSTSTMVTSIYFDNIDNLNTYQSRLARKEGASLFRMRWYGSKSPEKGGNVFLEQKVLKGFEGLSRDFYYLCIFIYIICELVHSVAVYVCVTQLACT